MNQTIPREILQDFKYCMKCGKPATFPNNVDVFQGPNEKFFYTRCMHCQTEMSWRKPQTLINKIKKNKEKDPPCRKCGQQIMLQSISHKNNKHLQKAYYFTHYLKCTGCATIYMDERYKVINK